MRKIKSIFLGIGVVLGLFLIAGCTPSYQTYGPSDKTTMTEPVIMTKDTGLGTILVGKNGMTLYDFRADTSGMSTCYGQCAVYWPPLLIPAGVQPTGIGTTAILGVTQRTDGTYQVTANGLPLYYYLNDKIPGDTNGQGSTGAGALWYVLDPAGNEITTPLGK